MLDKRYITNIVCTCKEYRLCNGKWNKNSTSVYGVDSSSLNSMLESSSYFTNLGGYMSVYYYRNRRFGIVPNKVVCISVCGLIKKVFSFNYNQARVF